MEKKSLPRSKSRRDNMRDRQGRKHYPSNGRIWMGHYSESTAKNSIRDEKNRRSSKEHHDQICDYSAALDPQTGAQVHHLAFVGILKRSGHLIIRPQYRILRHNFRPLPHHPDPSLPKLRPHKHRPFSRLSHQIFHQQQPPCYSLSLQSHSHRMIKTVTSTFFGSPIPPLLLLAPTQAPGFSHLRPVIEGKALLAKAP